MVCISDHVTTNGVSKAVTNGAPKTETLVDDTESFTESKLKLPSLKLSRHVLVSQFEALFYKRLHHVRRDIKFLVISVSATLYTEHEVLS